MSSQTADYSEIDPILDRWAKDHAVEWERDYKGWDVRSIHWPLAGTESVQLWVDEPVGGAATVHVCHNTSKGGQQNKTARAANSQLEPVLNESFDFACSLAEKLKSGYSAKN